VQFSLWSILNIPLAIAALRNNTLPRACAGGRQNGVVWCVRFKQRAVIEFLFTDRQLG
jgi:hypothetical protein